MMKIPMLIWKLPLLLMSLSSQRSNGTWRKQHKKRETTLPTTKIVSDGIPLPVFWCVANAVQL